MDIYTPLSLVYLPFECPYLLRFFQMQKNRESNQRSSIYLFTKNVLFFFKNAFYRKRIVFTVSTLAN